MRRNIKGFTLIELMLVMALVGILATIGLGSYSTATVKSKDTKRKTDLNQISKALESFNNDVARYPKVDVNGNMTCPGSSGSEVGCLGSVYAYIGDNRTTYMVDFPTDPLSGNNYVYVPSADYGSYSLYAALENDQDKDWVKTSDGDNTDWGVSCGSDMCNYKITETGLDTIND